jgi:hypothetical protein
MPFSVVLLAVPHTLVSQGGERGAAGGRARVRRWHAEAGLLCWDLLCVMCLLGLCLLLHISFANLLVSIVCNMYHNNRHNYTD